MSKRLEYGVAVDPTDLERSVRALHEVFLRTGHAVREVLARHGLAEASAHALAVIDPGEPPPSMTALAARLWCNAPNASFIARQLEARGLVERDVDEADRRSRVLRLTPAGLAVREDVVAATLAGSPLAGLRPGELSRLAGLLSAALAAPTRSSTAPPAAARS